MDLRVYGKVRLQLFISFISSIVIFTYSLLSGGQLGYVFLRNTILWPKQEIFWLMNSALQVFILMVFYPAITTIGVNLIHWNRFHLIREISIRIQNYALSTRQKQYYLCLHCTGNIYKTLFCNFNASSWRSRHRDKIRIIVCLGIRNILEALVGFKLPRNTAKRACSKSSSL